jgi:hypothetical protein
MGRGKKSYLHDFVGMTAHGAISGALLAAAFYDRGWYWPLAAGLLCAPCYEVSWRLNPQRGPRWFTGGTQPAELLWGGVMAIGCFLAA